MIGKRNEVKDSNLSWVNIDHYRRWARVSATRTAVTIPTSMRNRTPIQIRSPGSYTARKRPPTLPPISSMFPPCHASRQHTFQHRERSDIVPPNFMPPDNTPPDFRPHDLTQPDVTPLGFTWLQFTPFNSARPNS